MVELVAHRVADRPALLRAAADVADALELDVHRFRRRLEVRHAKVVWPTSMQWDRWWFDPRPACPPGLLDVLDALPTTATVWLDLKGCSTKLTADVLAALPRDRPMVVSSRCWWILRPARQSGRRVLCSVGSRWQLRSLGLVRRWPPDVGIAVADRLLEPGVLARLRRRTTDVVVWGVHDVERAVELAAAGATGLIVDDLVLIGEIRRRTR